MKRFTKDVLLPLARNMLFGAALFAFVASLVYSPNLKATQASCIMPTTGTVTGLTLVNDINACNGSMLSLYSGATAPGSPTTNMLWANTATNFVQYYDGVSWINLWFIDATNHLISFPIGGGVITGALTSASTTDIGSLSQSFVQVNLGTSPITSFGTSAAVGTIHIIQFNGAITLTHNATSLILPGGQPINAVAGDIAFAMYLGGGNWRVLNFSPATGASVTNSAVPLGTVLYGDYATPPVKTVYGFGQALSRAAFPAYFAATTRVQTATLTSGNATITAVANVAGLGAGMPVEGTGIQSGTVIVSVSAGSIVMSKTATANGSQTISVLITGYGSGGDSTTVGVRDCRDRVMAGRGDMGGTDAARFTPSYFGQTASGLATVIGSTAGGESYRLLLGDLPTGISSNNAAQSITVGVPSGSLIGGTPTTVQAGTGGSFTGISLGTGFTLSSFTSPNAISVTSNNTGGNAHPIVQPTGIAECVVAVLP
jgi:hypothetical protein